MINTYKLENFLREDCGLCIQKAQIAIAALTTAGVLVEVARGVEFLDDSLQAKIDEVWELEKQIQKIIKSKI